MIMAKNYKWLCNLVFISSPSRLMLNSVNGEGCKFGYKGFKRMCTNCENCYQRRKTMDRLTVRKNGKAYSDCENCKNNKEGILCDPFACINRMVEKLCRLEEEIESGLLAYADK
jgi:hypothetical protein